MTALARLARWRVPLGFACAAAAFWLARPTPFTIALGALIALPGEVLRVWASGHLDKGREITRSGPYGLVRHPLYLGSAIMATGFAIAAGSWAVAGLVAAYVGVTFTAAIRTEEAALDQRFAGGYAAYRDGRAAAVVRPFSLARAAANREWRAVVGFVLSFGLLALRWWGLSS